MDRMDKVEQLLEFFNIHRDELIAAGKPIEANYAEFRVMIETAEPDLLTAYMAGAEYMWTILCGIMETESPKSHKLFETIWEEMDTWHEKLYGYDDT